MKVEQLVCDECKAVRGEANHWHRIGVLTIMEPVKSVQLMLGVIPDKPIPNFEIHDICGQQCYHKHIDVLLGFSKQPPPLPVEDKPVEVEVWRGGIGYTGV